MIDAAMENPGLNEDSKAATARSKQFTTLSQHLIRRSEAEKAELARKLHDEFGALLTAASLDIAAVVDKLAQSEPVLANRLQRALARIKEAADLKRDMVERLHPGMLDVFGLAACLDHYAREFGKRCGLTVVLRIDSVADAVDADRAIALFRVAQEALCNIERHAQAKEVSIFLRSAEEGVLLLVEDDGIGIEHDALDRAASFGLRIVRERTAIYGGRLAVRPRDGGGTALEAWLPLAG